MTKPKLNIFWFRRDLRLDDNAGLYHALRSGKSVLPIFIFDKNILLHLDNQADARVSFLMETVLALKNQLENQGSSLAIFYDTPESVFKHLVEIYDIESVFTNRDYEPYALQRDEKIKIFLQSKNIDFQTFKDHVIFEKLEVCKDDGLPYTVFTPYSRKWLAKLESQKVLVEGQHISFYLKAYPTEKYHQNFWKCPPLSNWQLTDIGFQKSAIAIPSLTVARSVVKMYDQTRNFPALAQGTTKLGIHFRFGTISIREKALTAQRLNATFLNELIWRDFYSQILANFSHIGEGKAFRREYDAIEWRQGSEAERDFRRWCEGKTGYPMVDAGMRELNATGYMHNRVRMIVSSFLCKHLLLDWRWGEAYFAKKLLDFDLASNNGGWQWAAGSGTDAAPYFRIFNPTEQQKKFDEKGEYVRRWVKEYGTPTYPTTLIDHKFARERCLLVYKNGLKK
jgi:deoxyribodipyrimidine photo-lyase